MEATSSKGMGTITAILLLLFSMFLYYDGYKYDSDVRMTISVLLIGFFTMILFTKFIKRND